MDVAATLKKLNADIRPYKILGACNPPFAFKTLQQEPDIGLMLPCNVIVYINENGKTVIAAIDPVASMAVVENSALEDVAVIVQDKLKRVVDQC